MIVSTDDRSEFKRTLTEIRTDREVEIVLRRGATSLPLQAVRLVRLSRASTAPVSLGGQERRGEMLVVGPPSLDIREDDRFTYGGVLYRVAFVRPHRSEETRAEAEVVR